MNEPPWLMKVDRLSAIEWMKLWQTEGMKLSRGCKKYVKSAEA
jgi:hypothetical protein